MYIQWGGDQSNFVELGRQALQYFQNEMAVRYPGEYDWSFERLIDYCQRQEQTPGDYFFGDEESPLNSFGKSIYVSKISDGRVADAMKELAKQSGGKLPRASRMAHALNSALVGELGRIDFEALGDASIEVAKSVINTTNQLSGAVVDSAVSLAENAKWIIPALLALGVFIYARGARGMSA